MSFIELAALGAAILATLYQIWQIAKCHAIITVGRGLTLRSSLYFAIVACVAMQVGFVAVVTR